MLDFVIAFLIAVLGLAGLIGLYFLYRRYRVQIHDFFVAVGEGERFQAGLFWSVLALIYVGLLYLGSKISWDRGLIVWGGKAGWDTFMLTVGVSAALAVRIGRGSINKMFDSETAYQIPVISLLVVAIFTWIWPYTLAVKLLSFILVGVWALNFMPERKGWERFNGEWGRTVVFRSTQVAVFLVVSWSVFRFLFPTLGPAVAEARHNAERAVATWVRNPTWPSFGEDKPVAKQPASAPTSQNWMPASAAADMKANGKNPPMSEEKRQRSESEIKNLVDKLATAGQLPVADGRIPYPGEVVNGKVKPPESSPAGPKPAPRPSPAGEDQIQKELREAFAD